jgi:cation transport protein ChaC
MLQHTLQQWQAHGCADLWLFAYGSLIWKTDFPVAEQRRAWVYGHHRALRMWSRVNRGTPAQPGLVFALLPGGSCQGMALRVAASEVPAVLPKLWEREMPLPTYDPQWLRCHTQDGCVQALAFTLSRRSPSYTGALSTEQLRTIFAHACGRYGSTLDYARLTHQQLQAMGIRDQRLASLMQLANDL